MAMFSDGGALLFLTYPTADSGQSALCALAVREIIESLRKTNVIARRQETWAAPEKQARRGAGTTTQAIANEYPKAFA